MPEKKLVIIGASAFGKSVVNSILNLKLADKIELTVIEKRNFNNHNIANLRAVVDDSWIDKVFIPLDKLLPEGSSSKLIQGTVEKISKDSVTLAGGDVISFDYLVIATGSMCSSPGKLPSDDIEECKNILKKNSLQIKDAKSVLIVGGGSVGIELAGEIAYHYPEKTITLVHSGKTLLSPNFKPKFLAKAKSELERMKVKVILDDKISIPSNDVPGTLSLTTQNGTSIDSDLRFSCIGIIPQGEIIKTLDENLVDAKGYIKVKEETFQLDHPDYPNIFAIGDVCNHSLPKVLAVGAPVGAYVAQCIKSMTISPSAPLKPFKTNTTPFMVLPVGKSAGVSQLPVFGGLVLGNRTTQAIKSDFFLGKTKSEYRIK